MSIVQDLRDLGFTHVSFDMVRTVSITAWRGSERKTYSAMRKPTIEAAVAALITQINAPAAEPDDFEDIL